MKTKIKLLFAVFIFLSFVLSNSGSAAVLEPLKEAYIRYEQTSWQTYEFFVVTNLDDKSQLGYEWNFDSRDTFNTDKVQYFFKHGGHTVNVKVEDKYGNVRYDTVKLSVKFWSLKNNWFWWVIYLLLILIIIYYWIIKIFYLLNRRKISKEIRLFLDVLDEHGWIEKLIREHLANKRVRNKK